MKHTRVAVIGTGHLGRVHARFLSSMRDVELVAVCDTNADTREKVAAEFGTQAVDDYRKIIPFTKTAIIATPSVTHYQIAADLLRAGIHLLVEKPITTSAKQARQLVQLAEENNCVLQVGQVERFNPAFRAAQAETQQPRYIDARRAGGFTSRSTDVGVVFDLMIHDIDLILQLVKSRVAKVTSMGGSLVTQHEDVAQARLEFENGCVADLSASRVSSEATRRMNIFESHGYTCVDFAAKTAEVVRPATPSHHTQDDPCQLSAPDRRQLAVSRYDALRAEIRDFVSCVREGRRPRVTGLAGCQAVEVAEQIISAIDASRWDRGADQEPTIIRPSVWAEEKVTRRKAG